MDQSGLNLERLFNMNDVSEVKETEEQRDLSQLIDQIGIMALEITSMRKQQEELIKIVDKQKESIESQNHKIDILQSMVLAGNTLNISQENTKKDQQFSKADLAPVLNKLEQYDEDMKNNLQSIKEQSDSQLRMIIQEIKNVLELETESQVSLSVNIGTDLSNRSSVQSIHGSQIYCMRISGKYHYDGCGYLNKSQYLITLQEAQSLGLKACSRCDR